MAKASGEYQDYPEADCAAGCPHPRYVYSLLGHEVAEKKLAAGLASKRLHHAWLLSGPKGVGKATLAYRFARAILGGKAQTAGALDVPADDPSARRVASFGHGDFLLIRRPYDQKTKKLKTEIVVSEIQRIHEFFAYKASEDGYRVCLIDSADEMNRNAANAVLKILEEPPAKTVIILLSSEPGKLLPTIRSRCLNVKLRPVEHSVIKSWLLEQSIDVKMAELAAQFSRGAPGRAFALAQAEKEILRPLAGWLSALPNPPAMAAHTLAQGLNAKASASLKPLFWDALADILAQQARYAATGEWDGVLSPLTISRQPDDWTTLWTEIQALRNREGRVNLEPYSVALTALNAIETGKRLGG